MLLFPSELKRVKMRTTRAAEDSSESAVLGDRAWSMAAALIHSSELSLGVRISTPKTGHQTKHVIPA